MTLGAVWDSGGVDFRVVAGQADRVTLCLFEAPNDVQAARVVELERCQRSTALDGIWHTRLLDLEPGQLYGYRVDGPWSPRQGLLHNPAKLLIDPWARAVTGEPQAASSLFPFDLNRRVESFDGRDSAGMMPKGVVIDPSFDWQGVEAPRTPWRDTVIYEAHVGGMTRLHGGVAGERRGTYLGLCEPPVLEHLKKLGVTAIELMPVHQGAPEAHLLDQGKRNYWGYSPVSFFAPTAAYAENPLGGQVREFQTLVREMHRAGLEVLVDVVFNHTAEGGLNGPAFGMKGFDARAFYRWARRRPVDWTGCGNTLDISSPVVLETVLASLRYWAGVLGVDGFRLDLAPTVGRDGGRGDDGFNPHARLFEEIAKDPLLARCKWVAEPWDLGPGGYQLGAFPAPWAEWNDRFRDASRRFWRGEASGGLAVELAARMTGSADLFGARSPFASLNYIVAHDGFTLADLVSYERKHNLANGEQNRDGRDENFSRNWGEEGPSDDPEVCRMRNRARRNLLATLLLSRGVPMLSHGDELGRSQGGNNNAYCQDNEVSWVDWSRPEPELLHFLRGLMELRRRFSALRGAPVKNAQSPAAASLRSAGGESRSVDDWQQLDDKAFMLFLPGDEELVVAVNGADHEVPFYLPTEPGASWHQWLATATASFDARRLKSSEVVVEGLSLAVFSRG